MAEIRCCCCWAVSLFCRWVVERITQKQKHHHHTQTLYTTHHHTQVRNTPPPPPPQSNRATTKHPRNLFVEIGPTPKHFISKPLCAHLVALRYWRKAQKLSRQFHQDHDLGQLSLRRTRCACESFPRSLQHSLEKTDQTQRWRPCKSMRTQTCACKWLMFHVGSAHECLHVSNYSGDVHPHAFVQSTPHQHTMYARLECPGIRA